MAVQQMRLHRRRGTESPVAPPNERTAVQDAQRELRKAQREAADLWRTKRLEARLPRFTDPAALRSVKYAVERCFGAVSWFHICRAIEKHAADPFSKSPWMLDVWARDEKAEHERVSFEDLPLDEQERILRAKLRA